MPSNPPSRIQVLRSANRIRYVGLTLFALLLRVGYVLAVGKANIPLLIFTSALLYTETLFLFFLTALACGFQLLGLIGRFRFWLAIALGILFGAAALLRPTVQFLPVFLFGWAAFGVPKLYDGIRLVAVMTLTMFLVMAPWALRNYQVTGELVLVSANGGMNLLQGNYDGADGSAMHMADLPPFPGMTEKQRDDAYWRLGADWIKAHPVEFLKLAPLKLGMFLSPVEASNQGRLFGSVAPFLIGIAALYYLIGLVGVAFSLKEWRRWLLPYILIAYPAALAIVFSGGTRYGMVIQPFVALFVALALCVLVPQVLHYRGVQRTAQGD